MSSPSKLHRTPALWTLYSILGLFSFFVMAIGPAVPFLRAEFHLDYTLAALHVSAFAIGMVVVSFFSARLIHRFGLHAALWFGLLGMLAGLTGLVLAPTPWVSLVSLLFSGMAGNICLAAVPVGVASQAGEHRGKALLEANIIASLFSAAGPAALVVGTALGTGWRSLWFFYFLALAATMVLGYRAVAKTIPDRPATEASSHRPLPRAYLKVWLLIFLGVAVEWCLGFWSASYLKGLPGTSDGWAVAGAGAFQIAALFGRWGSSRLTGRFSEKKILAGAIVVTAVGFPLFWSLANPVIAVIGLVLCGMATAVFFPLGSSLGLGVAGSQAAQASARNSLGSGSAILLAPLSLGAVADHWGLSTALLAAPVGLALMAALLLIRRKS